MGPPEVAGSLRQRSPILKGLVLSVLAFQSVDAASSFLATEGLDLQFVSYSVSGLEQSAREASE
jgi:hypothetical protein